MSNKFKVLYYVNQFFGQIGGEDKAGIEPMYKEETVGPALGFNGLISEEGEVIGTIICGDNYFNENKEEAMKFILDIVKKTNPDIVVTGPAFNAGRYGMACGEIAKAIVEQLNIPAVTGMYVENPGVDVCKGQVIIASTSDSAAGMRKALPVMANIVKKYNGGCRFFHRAWKHMEISIFNRCQWWRGFCICIFNNLCIDRYSFVYNGNEFRKKNSNEFSRRYEISYKER